ncbi:hypothetical protein DQP55_10810 [Mycolicibacterium sp. GF69]|uniref:lipoprotein LpqH n=1 Tax=Mycolicibacterium sp. GF69 TaxID=2267251 RepID=UPI000DCE5FC2|nr:lipoprotein LpqH [Mycolicibacterium sp. GF69]RAV13190.1 hypothetical protein DQP55_10810 [Mycolicibacterium sp. GF69]
MVRDVHVARIAAALLVAGGLPGCSSPPPAAPDDMGGTAEVSIDSHATGDRHYITCAKMRWLLTIETGSAAKGFTAIVDTDDGGTDAEVVKIRDLGGFTGSAWAGGVGQVQAERDHGEITISGTGYGFFADDPHRPATTPFVITAAC